MQQRRNPKPTPARFRQHEVQHNSSTGLRLSRYELYSVAASTAALLVALTAAVVQPYVQARFFNEYAERGILQLVSAPGEGQPEQIYKQQCISCHADENGNVEIDAALLNVGRRPLTAINFVLTSSEGQLSTQSIAIDGKELTENGRNKNTATYAYSSALAPGDQIVVKLKIHKHASLLVRTEHGQSVALLEPRKWREFTKEDADAALRHMELGNAKVVGPKSQLPK